MLTGRCQPLKSKDHWELGSNESRRWVRACEAIQDILNSVPSRKNSGDRVEDVLRAVIHEFCHTEFRDDAAAVFL